MRAFPAYDTAAVHGVLWGAAAGVFGSWPFAFVLSACAAIAFHCVTRGLYPEDYSSTDQGRPKA